MTGSAAGALFLVAQLGLGLAGFSGVAVALTHRGPRFHGILSYRVGILLGATLGATFLALVPVVLTALGIGDLAAGRVASALMAAFTVGYAAYYGAGIRAMHAAMPELVSAPAVIAVLVGHGANLMAQSGAALGFFGPWAGVYLAGLFWLLLHGAYQFGRILFIRPAGESGDGERL